MDVLFDVLIIIILFAFFGYTHTLLASEKVKIKFKKVFGDLIAFYRLLYNIITIASLYLIYILSPKPRITIYDLQNRFDLSEKHYRAALEINPDFVAAANNLAFILADQDRDIEEAFNFARMAKEKYPNDPNVMDTLGWVYYRKGLYDSAIGEFSDCLEKMPENPTVIYHLGMAYYKKGDLENARAELAKALQLDESFNGADEAKRILAEL